MHRGTPVAAAAALVFGRHDDPALGLGQGVGQHDDVRGPLALRHDGAFKLAAHNSTLYSTLRRTKTSMQDPATPKTVYGGGPTR